MRLAVLRPWLSGVGLRVDRAVWVFRQVLRIAYAYSAFLFLTDPHVHAGINLLLLQSKCYEDQ